MLFALFLLSYFCSTCSFRYSRPFFYHISVYAFLLSLTLFVFLFLVYVFILSFAFLLLLIFLVHVFHLLFLSSFSYFCCTFSSRYSLFFLVSIRPFPLSFALHLFFVYIFHASFSYLQFLFCLYFWITCSFSSQHVIIIIPSFPLLNLFSFFFLLFLVTFFSLQTSHVHPHSTSPSPETPNQLTYEVCLFSVFFVTSPASNTRFHWPSFPVVVVAVAGSGINSTNNSWKLW